MYGLTTTSGRIKFNGRARGLAVALAALVFLSVLPTQARAQGTNTYGGLTVIHGATIGLVPGQTVLVTVPNFYFLDGSVIWFVKHAIKVYDRQSNGVTEYQSKLVYSGESGSLEHEFGHAISLRHGDLPVPGEPGTDRKQVWIEIESFLPSATQEQAEVRSAVLLPPTLELIDDRSGKTVVFDRLLPVMPAQTQSQVTSTNTEGGLQLEVSKSVRRALYGQSSSGDAPAPGTNFDLGFQFKGGVSVGAARGQTVRVVFRSTNDIPSLEPSEKPEVIVAAPGFGGHMKAFNAATGALLWSRELTGLTSGLNTIDINRDELREVGNPDTGRIQLWIEVVLAGMKVSLPAFEVFDNESGKTTVNGPMKESMETMKKAWKDES
jgi:hypothetical protein